MHSISGEFQSDVMVVGKTSGNGLGKFLMSSLG